MHESDIHVAWLIIAAFQEGFGAPKQAVIACACRLREEASGLVDDQEVIVLMKYLTFPQLKRCMNLHESPSQFDQS